MAQVTTLTSYALPGQLYGNFTGKAEAVVNVGAPDARVFAVDQEARTFAVDRDARVLAIDDESRVLAI
jgi:hypothetical protein